MTSFYLNDLGIVHPAILNTEQLRQELLLYQEITNFIPNDSKLPDQLEKEEMHNLLNIAELQS